MCGCGGGGVRVCGTTLNAVVMAPRCSEQSAAPLCALQAVIKPQVSGWACARVPVAGSLAGWPQRRTQSAPGCGSLVAWGGPKGPHAAACVPAPLRCAARRQDTQKDRGTARRASACCLEHTEPLLCVCVCLHVPPRHAPARQPRARTPSPAQLDFLSLTDLPMSVCLCVHAPLRRAQARLPRAWTS